MQEGLLIGAGQCMEMDALRQQGQGPGRLGPPDELLDVIPAGKAQATSTLALKNSFWSFFF